MAASPLRLAYAGQPVFQVLFPHNPTAPEEFAAEELSRTLRAMTGAPARSRNSVEPGGVRIHLNQPEAAAQAGIRLPALGREQYHLETAGNELHILGGGPRGLLYGVYDLLDSLGCRWYTPEVSSIPHQPDLRLPALRRTSGPAFENRDTFNSDAGDPLWRVRNRMNGWSVSIPEYMGGSLDYCGFVHTFYSLLPVEEFFSEHPEYYSLVGGTRRREWAQLCLTNPDVLRIVTERVRKLMRENPRATIFSVSQNDCYAPCECPSCRAIAAEEGSESGPMIRFVNAVAEETSKEFPDKLIDTLAYQYTLDAPRHARPHPNVRVRLCSITCCQGHTYGTCDHPESLRVFKALREWGERTDQIYVWHYATDFEHYPLPMPDFDELHGNLNLYKKSGVRGLFIQGMGEPGGGAESMALRGWVVSRLLWNPDQAVWPLVDEFLPAYYGKAAAGVRRYLDIFHEAVRKDRTLHLSLFDVPTARQFAPALVKPAEKALDEAEELVRGAEKQRLQLLRSSLRYARLYQAAGEFALKGDIYKGSAKPADQREFAGVVRLWKRALIQRVQEARDFDFSVQLLRARLQPHDVIWLDDDDQRLAVVPGLGGRLVSWRVGDREWLAPPVGDNWRALLPYAGGYSEFTQLEMYVRRGWAEKYRPGWRDGKLVLAADVGRGLRLTRTLWLEDGVFCTRSRMRNASAVPLDCSWGAELRLLLPEQALLSWQDASGAVVSPFKELPLDNSATFSGGSLPQGSWRVESPQGSFALSFRGDPLVSFALARQENPLRLSAGWRTIQAHLGPGQSVRFEQRIQISRS